jgi:hypothetical protein
MVPTLFLLLLPQHDEPAHPRSPHLQTVLPAAAPNGDLPLLAVACASTPQEQGLPALRLLVAVAADVVCCSMLEHTDRSQAPLQDCHHCTEEYLGMLRQQLPTLLVHWTQILAYPNPMNGLLEMVAVAVARCSQAPAAHAAAANVLLVASLPLGAVVQNLTLVHVQYLLHRQLLG